MPEVQHLAWGLKPIFASDQDVWAWGAEPRGEDDPQYSWSRPKPTPTRPGPDGTVLKPTALFHSADQGLTSTAIYSPEPLVAPLSQIREMVGEPAATFSSSRYLDQKRFVVQVDDRRAYAWVSERTWYHLDDDSGAWVERQKTPSLLPRWLAQDATSTRYFWSNGDYQVVSKWGYTIVPRLLMPFSRERAELQTDAHFYTRDGGRSWRQLAIPGYLGVMGLSPQGSKLYWSKGNWYSNDEPQQWEYDLAR